MEIDIANIVARYSHFFIELIVFIILSYIWYKYNYYYRKVNELKDEADYGLILLSSGMLIWGLISLFKASNPNIKIDEPVF